MKVITIKLPDDLAERTEALKEKSGISEAAIIRQAIQAGLSRVEAGLDFIHAPETQTA
jgi:predicted transcriptional regulator